VQSDDGYTWFVFDENGVPLGAWVWSDEEDMWLFEDYVPLGAFESQLDELPATGLHSNVNRLVLLLGLSVSAAAMAGVGVRRELKRHKAS